MPAESQPDEAKVRARIRRLLDAGALPVMHPTSGAAGYGSGKKCDACDQPMMADQVEYKLAHADAGVSLRLHLTCYVLWQLLCGLSGGQRRAGRSCDRSPP